MAVLQTVTKYPDFVMQWNWESFLTSHWLGSILIDSGKSKVVASTISLHGKRELSLQLEEIDVLFFKSIDTQAKSAIVAIVKQSTCKHF